MADIHNRKSRQEKDLQKLEEHPSLEERNLNQITKFINQIKAEGSSKDRIHNYLWSFNVLADSINFQLDNASREDLIELVGKINNNELKPAIRQETEGEGLNIELQEKDYGIYSKAEFRKTLSKMYRAFYNEEDKIDFISTDPKEKNKSKLKAEELPKPEHVKEMIRAANNSRDEALIMTLWDTGARIEAVLNLKWKNFDPGNSYIRFTERNKTMLRKIPVAESVPSLKKWSDEHPSPDPEEYIFTKYEGNKATKSPGLEPVKYSTVYSMIQERTRPEADIPSKVKTNPHAFRKGRATFLAASGMNVNMLAKYMGWNDITTAEKYVSLAQNQLTSSFKEAVGLETEQQDEGLEISNESIRPGKCPSCNAVVSNAWTYCYSCGDTLEGDHLLDLLETDETKVDIDLSAKIGAKAALNPDKSINEIKEEVLQEHGVE